MKNLRGPVVLVAVTCLAASMGRAQTFTAGAAAGSAGAAGAAGAAVSVIPVTTVPGLIPGDMLTLPFGSPEFGYSIERQVESHGPGMFTGGKVTISYHTPPAVKVMERYARNATLPEEKRLNAVKALATLSAHDGAMGTLERIAVKVPAKSSSPQAERVSTEAILGLGQSSLPRTKTFLQGLSTNGKQPFQKAAAKTALERIAQREEDEASWGY